MMKWSVKKEIIPNGWLHKGKPSDGSLISFSAMESFSGLFSQSGAFVSFGGPKERGDRLRVHNVILGNQAGLKALTC